MSTREAVEMASHFGVKCTIPTMISWCKNHGVGHQVGKGGSGKWIINIEKFVKFLHGESE